MVEVVYISTDITDTQFKEHYAKMPWITIKYDNKAMRDKLHKHYDIIGIPVLLVLDATSGFLISKKGRKDICDLGVGCIKNWEDEMPDALAKYEHLREGARMVEE